MEWGTRADGMSGSGGNRGVESGGNHQTKGFYRVNRSGVFM